MTPSQIYKKLDTSLEGFFFKRPFTLKNFNFLLMVLAEQRKMEQAESVLDKLLVTFHFAACAWTAKPPSALPAR